MERHFSAMADAEKFKLKSPIPAKKILLRNPDLIDAYFWHFLAHKIATEIPTFSHYVTPSFSGINNALIISVL